MAENISRRDFLKLAVGAATTAVLTGCGPSFENSSADWQASSKISQFISDEFGTKWVHVGEAFSVAQRTWTDIDGKITMLEYDEIKRGYGKATDLTETLYKRLSRYAPEFINNIITIPYSIFLGNNLRLQEQDKINPNYVNGVYWPSQSGEPVICMSTDSSSYAQVYDHEVFHHIVSVRNERAELQSRFNDINRKYGLPTYTEEYELNITNVACELHILKAKGSASCYGATNAEEDGAEIARALMNGNKTVWQQAYSDLALRDKMVDIIEIYKDLSNGNMNEEFFGKLSNGQREGFWNWPKIPQEFYS